MIPCYNPPRDYLEQTLQSVLVQDPGPEQMQIEVVDDCSPATEVKAMVQSIAGERVTVSRTPKNLGLAGCWNACIERARGEWVHILHQDDYVLPGFYQKLKEVSEHHPEVALIATRSFFVDEDGVTARVSPRLPNLENGGRAVEEFFYTTPIQCPGVAVRRSFYEAHGGFLPELVFTLDCEMWARAVGLGGGVVIPEVLSCFRRSNGSATKRISKTADNLRDIDRLHNVFAKRYSTFDTQRAREHVCDTALAQGHQFFLAGDSEASRASMSYWKRNAPARLWFRRISQRIERILFG